MNLKRNSFLEEPRGLTRKKVEAKTREREVRNNYKKDLSASHVKIEEKRKTRGGKSAHCW